MPSRGILASAQGTATQPPRRRVDAPPRSARSLRNLPQPQHDEPAWSRPALIAVVTLAAALMLLDVTRSGYGNTYYAAGALAASHSWRALLDNAADLGGYVSLDKGPLPDWLMGLSGRVFGFGSFSVMVPNALYGIATVIVLHATVRRTLGHRIAIIAALIMALTPVAVLVGRYNAPDALLLFLLVCAAWALTVAVESGRLRELLLCAVLLGLAFNTKMLEAYLVLPALALTHLVAGRRSLRTLLGELALAAGAMLLVSLAWFGSMMLVPGGDRPYVGESSGNSWFRLILDGNGIERVTGSAGAFARNFESNVLYLFSRHVAGQITWLLPLALAGLVLGLLTTRSSRRNDIAFGAYVLWGTWALVGCVVLSFSAGTRHAYYTSLLAPAVATLAAAALVTLWRSGRSSPIAATGLALAIAATSGVSFAVLADSADFVPWLRWMVLGCGAVAGAAILGPHLQAAFRRPSITALALAAAAVASLAGPAAYSLVTATRDHTGYDPIAGPGPTEQTPASGAVGHSEELTPAQSVAALTAYLQAHRGRARFLLAATDAKTADPIALATRQPVITIGGFSGSDPAPTAGQLEQLVSSGELRYVLLDASRVMPTSAAERAISAPAWVEHHCSRVPIASVVPRVTNRSGQPTSSIDSKLTLFECTSA
jgi:4-amino-4-deoxy-L-arabinose transferase-like glycosyltransferase